jgi:hypothetical protein
VFGANLASHGSDAPTFVHVFREGATFVQVTVGANPLAATERKPTLPKARHLAELAALRVRSPGAPAPDLEKLAWLRDEPAPEPPPPPRPREADDMDCPHCGAMQKTHYKFCLRCAQLLRSEPRKR